LRAERCDTEQSTASLQSANGVIHLIVESVRDLSAHLKTVSGLATAFPLSAGRV
jgi:hypothetical protein